MNNKNDTLGTKKDYKNNALTYCAFIKLTSLCNYFTISICYSVQTFESLKGIVNIAQFTTRFMVY